MKHLFDEEEKAGLRDEPKYIACAMNLVERIRTNLSVLIASNFAQWKTIQSVI